MKAKELRDMTSDEVAAKEAELKKELFGLRMQHSMGQAETPSKIRLLKRDIARAKTIFKEKEGVAKDE